MLFCNVIPHKLAVLFHEFPAYMLLLECHVAVECVDFLIHGELNLNFDE